MREVVVARVENGDYIFQVPDALTREHALSLASQVAVKLGIDGKWGLVEDWNDVSAGWVLTLRPDVR